MIGTGGNETEVVSMLERDKAQNGALAGGRGLLARSGR